MSDLTATVPNRWVLHGLQVESNWIRDNKPAVVGPTTDCFRVSGYGTLAPPDLSDPGSRIWERVGASNELLMRLDQAVVVSGQFSDRPDESTVEQARVVLERIAGSLPTIPKLTSPSVGRDGSIEITISLKRSIVFISPEPEGYSIIVEDRKDGDLKESLVQDSSSAIQAVERQIFLD